jgi:hypothetical protein
LKHRTYPKDGIRKLKQIIHDLKAELNFYIRENKFLAQEIENLVKPIRKRKPEMGKELDTYERWRHDFLKRFKKDVLDKNEKT